MPTRTSRTRPPIAILTDFGYRDHYVGAMKGVIASISPGAQIIDITHGIPAQQVMAGALALRESVRFFPRGTVFLAVVDPGVGTSRLPIALETRDGTRMVGPDNGLLWPAVASSKIKAIVELRSQKYRLPELSATFHGRDLFAPAAAWLWKGLPIALLGPKRPTMIELEPEAEVIEAKGSLKGAIIYVDTYGNLVCNISEPRLRSFIELHGGCRLSIKVKGRASLDLHKAYGDVAQGVPLAVLGSFGLLEIAVRNGDAAKHFAVQPGEPIVIQARARRAIR